MTDMEQEHPIQLAEIIDPSGAVLHWTLQMPKPPASELARIQIDKLHDPVALQFAYLPESLRGNPPNKELAASEYGSVHIEEGRKNGTIYYRRYGYPESPNLGLVLTDITNARIACYPDGQPMLFQMGPDQRTLAIAQRAEFFLENQNSEIHAYIDALESGKRVIPPRPIRGHTAVERGLEFVDGEATRTIALEQIGYKKISSGVLVSRDPDKNGYLLNKIGRYYRRIILGGSMPPASGGVDALVTEALAHMATFIPRNSIFNGDIDRQILMARKAHDTIDSLSMPDTWKERAKRNIGASLGIENPQKALEEARRLYREGGIRLFRIYTIGSDPRIVELAKLLRQDKEMGDTIEIFAGQIPDKKLASRLIDEAQVDALIFGHGGGRQCTSADNGMAVTTLEEIYTIVTDPKFQHTTVLVEGGVGRNIGSMLILGVDGILYNGRLVRGTIESPAGDIYVKNKSGAFCQPYPGSASAETQLIESGCAGGHERTNLAGRIYTEGSPGFMTHERKAGGSMVFWINSLLRDAARCYADVGVRDISELRTLIADRRVQLLRLVSPEARAIGTAYKNG